MCIRDRFRTGPRSRGSSSARPWAPRPWQSVSFWASRRDTSVSGRGNSMAGLAQRLLNLDRRWLFLLVFLGVAIPILFPIGLPVTTTASTRAAFDFVEALRPGDTVLLSYDYGPSSAPENDPMADGFLRQCFTRKVRVIVIALYPLGAVSYTH